MKRLLGSSPKVSLAQFFPAIGGFRDCQASALDRIWRGQSSLVLMPTGAGKSLVYQLPVLASQRVGIVISPLIALMQQHAEQLARQGARVLSLGGMDASDAQQKLRDLKWDGGPTFLFLSPERTESDGYLEYVIRKNRHEVSLVTIDEAHCISEWGHDFRPPYKNLPGFLDRCFGRDGWPTTLCLTATLDANCQRETLADFRLESADVVRSPTMLRTNLDLTFKVFPDGDAKQAALEQLLDEHRDEKLIVYAHRKHSKKHGTRSLAERLRAKGHLCEPFDADLPPQQKSDTLKRFIDGSVKVVIATGAFGMGVDVPDIRGVVHYLLPESLESYYQEVGRAGRDGKPAFGQLLYTAVNSKVRRDMIDSARKTADDVRGAWDNVCNTGRAETKTVSPWVQFQGRDDEYALFYAFERLGAIRILARGPGRLKAFTPKGAEGAVLLQRLQNATKTGNTVAAVRQLQLDPAETMERLFELYHRGELELEQSPDKTLVFRTRPITETEVGSIVSQISRRVDAKLKKFDLLVNLIENEEDPRRALSAQFGP